MRVRVFGWALTVVLALSLAACGGEEEPKKDYVAIVTQGSVEELQAKAGLRPCPASTAKAGELPLVKLDCLGGGEPVYLARIGKPTVLNLWAAWCRPCAKELPVFAAVEAETVGRVQFLGVDTADDDKAGLTTLIDAGVRYPSVSDPERRVQKDLGLSGLPATIFVRADGTIAHTKFGAVADATELRQLLRTHLGVAT